jgi:hypothetical protein
MTVYVLYRGDPKRPSTHEDGQKVYGLVSNKAMLKQFLSGHAPGDLRSYDEFEVDEIPELTGQMGVIPDPEPLPPAPEPSKAPTAPAPPQNTPRSVSDEVAETSRKVRQTNEQMRQLMEQLRGKTTPKK